MTRLDMTRHDSPLLAFIPCHTADKPKMTTRPPSSRNKHHSQSQYTIFLIPVPTPKDYLEKYVALRLLGLKTDPQSFGSTYEASLLLTEADWRARIDSIDKATFIACNSDDEWVGTMIIVSPEALITAPPHWTMPSNVSAGTRVYMVIGTWVHLEHRRKGIGRMLMERGREWIRHRQQEKAMVGPSRLALQVYSHNVEAMKLYSGAGFEKVEGEEHVDGDERTKFWMISDLDDR